MKALSKISTQDLTQSPVWEYVRGVGLGEVDVYVNAVQVVPVTSLAGRILGTVIRLNNGEECWAILGNVDLANRRSTEQFLTLSIEKGGKWFDLARYHDADYRRRGPAQLANFLGLPIDAVFPIKYDISCIASGLPEVLCGTIPKEPRERLSQSELVQMALG